MAVGATRIAGNARETNRIVAIRRVASPARKAMPAREVELASTRPFPVGDALPTLSIGNRSFTLSRFRSSGNTDRLIFTLEADEYAAARSGAKVTLQVGRARPWEFGSFHKR